VTGGGAAAHLPGRWPSGFRTAMLNGTMSHKLLIPLGAALILTAACARPQAPASTAHAIQVHDGRFWLDGQPFQIRSGSIHYARVPRAYWRQRLEMARAMGLNTVTTYVFWDINEPRPGEFRFDGRRDVAAFVRTAGELGLHVIVRPGPYVCSEWDLGGIPAWLLADSATVVRSRDTTYLAAARRWIRRVGQELVPLQITRGGPIIGVQVENEYGSFGSDTAFMRAMERDYLDAGFDSTLLFTADGPSQLPRGALPGVRAVVNFGPGDAETAFAALHAFRPEDPLMAGEYWAGWFDGWGVAHHTTNAAREADEIGWMLDHGGSFNLYMFHGGTSFGFMSGANFYDDAYRPQTTSYDYDAALDEAGHVTPKYRAFREAIAKRLPAGDTLPTPPPAPPVIGVPSFPLEQSVSLFDALPEPVHRTRPEPMERLGQAYGFVLYRTRVSGPVSGTLAFDSLNDYGVVYRDGRRAATVDRRLKQQSATLSVPTGAHRLDVLVENDGRINFARQLIDERKGLMGSVRLAGRALTGWDIYPLPMDSAAVAGLRFRAGAAPGPAFYRGTFTVVSTGDTFLDLRGWGKGVVWVNGHNLGRFWNIGPQQTLYLPGPWLRAGANDVVVFTLDPPAHPTLQGLTEPILDSLGS
jgi:beta-galactosidase